MFVFLKRVFDQNKSIRKNNPSQHYIYIIYPKIVKSNYRKECFFFFLVLQGTVFYFFFFFLIDKDQNFIRKELPSVHRMCTKEAKFLRQITGV